MIASIGIIGSGNTAWQLAHHFVKSGVALKFIASRNQEAALQLASSLCTESHHISEFPEVEGLILCVTDTAIEEVSISIKDKSKWQAHCCGSVSIESLAHENKGVFYPLQTMTKGRFLEAKRIPVCVEANNAELESKLKALAKDCGFNSLDLNSEMRAGTHISAVMVNNFTNHVLAHAFKWAHENNIDKQVFRQLAIETIDKAFDLGAEKSQTGPAKRKNEAIISKHLDQLESMPESRELYNFLTNSIKKEFEQQ